MLKIEDPQNGRSLDSQGTPGGGATLLVRGTQVENHLSEKLPLRFGGYLLQKQMFLMQIAHRKWVSRKPVAFV